MSANTLIYPTWDPEDVGEELGFDPDDVGNVLFLNEAWWLHAGETEYANEIKLINFATGGVGHASQFLIIPDQGTFIYLQSRGFEAHINGLELYHAKEAEWQEAATLEDFEPVLTNWKLRAMA